MGWSPHRKTGLTYHQPSASVKGYTLVSPMGGDATYLIDMQGRIVHRWHLAGQRTIYSRLLPNGNLLSLGADASIPTPQIDPKTPPPFEVNIRRIGGNATRLIELDWDGNELWRYENQALHHDFVRLPNGNTLTNQFVEIPPELARQVHGGYRDAQKTPPLVSDDFVEIDRSGKEVRRTSLWKLLDPRRDPICPLERRVEWTHTNSLDVDADGNIAFSCRTNSRIGIIDGKSGKLRWKYGAPNIHHQHHATFLPNGNVQVFDNGMHRIGSPRSSVLEINPKDDSTVWQYVADPEVQFLSAHISGAHRLPGGNVLICEGATGRLFEVTRRGELVWEWISPFVNNLANGTKNSWVFRAYRYLPDDPALADRDLDPARCADFNRLFDLE